MLHELRCGKRTFNESRAEAFVSVRGLICSENEKEVSMVLPSVPVTQERPMLLEEREDPVLLSTGMLSHLEQAFPGADESDGKLVGKADNCPGGDSQTKLLQGSERNLVPKVWLTQCSMI